MHPLSPDSVQLELNSPDGDGGYPGNLSAKVLYKLDGNRLTIVIKNMNNLSLIRKSRNLKLNQTSQHP